MKSYAKLRFQSTQSSLKLNEVTGGLPGTGTAGQIIFYNKKVYVCANTTGPVWVPLTNETNYYVHTQASPDTTWTIVHNLGVDVIVQVWDPTIGLFFPDNLQNTSSTTTVVTLNTAATGTAVVLAGTTTGTSKSEQVNTFTQGSEANTWTINHGLGFYPIVRVYLNSGEEIQPEVRHTSKFQTLVLFSSSQSGTARLA